MNTRALTKQMENPGTELRSQAQTRLSILDTVALRYGMDPVGFQKTLRQTVFKDANNEEFAALLVVANEHGLNPLTKEIYAFKAQGGGIVPLVSIDGWIRIMNEHPAFDGVEYCDMPDGDGNLMAIECTIYRKDRSHPIKVIEYLSECKRNTQPWKDMPARMLRHKATIQCARYAFGFSGIYTEDDVESLAHGGDLRPIEAVPPMRNAKAIEQRASVDEPHYDPETGEVYDDQGEGEEQSVQAAVELAPTLDEAKDALRAKELVADINTEFSALRPHFSGEDAEDLQMFAAECIDALIKKVGAKEKAEA